jgi:hypothetical protein
MKKRTLNGLLIVILILCLTGVASATSLYSGDVTNVASMYQFEISGNATFSGSNWGYSNDGNAIWITDADTITTTFAFSVVTGQGIFVQFLHTDNNDGYAYFETSTNGTNWTGQGNVDTWENYPTGLNDGPDKYALISGLTTGDYYLRITSGDHSVGADTDDLHLDSFGTTSVPEPTTMLLLGFGLVGLAAARRKFKK